VPAIGGNGICSAFGESESVLPASEKRWAALRAREGARRVQIRTSAPL